MTFRLRRRKRVLHVGVSKNREVSRAIPRTNRAAMGVFDERFGLDLLSRVPMAPGIYRFFAEDGEVIYVGKAINLRNRLRQYRLANRRRRDWKMRSIVHAAARLEWEEAADALAAGVREVELIQTLRPRGNVASAFAFMYPLVGVQSKKDGFFICTTTHPEAFVGWELHGAFRSRALVADAFFALMRLLTYLGHPIPRARLRPEVDLPHSRVFGFRQLPEPITLGLQAFYQRGDLDVLLTLTMALLDKASARARAADVKADLAVLKRFWRDELAPLQEAVVATGFATWPVAQEERDPLFLRWRALGPETRAPARRKTAAPKKRRSVGSARRARKGP